eukprot:COSAG03_NODE_7481_length_911_cov_1.713054_2_plen_54_part_01
MRKLRGLTAAAHEPLLGVSTFAHRRSERGHKPTSSRSRAPRSAELDLWVRMAEL